eukprot:8933662-Karenia_brevis.AAC.1
MVRRGKRGARGSGSGSESDCSIGESVIARRKRLGMPDNKFRDDDEEEESSSDRSRSSSSTPPTPETRPPIGAPRDFIAKKEEEEDINKDEL